MNNKACIKGIASYLPDYQLTNEELSEKYPEWNVEKIYKKTGISSRSIVAPGECVSDMAVAAAQKLFNKKVCVKEEIECLILCTQSPDYFLPSTACIIQDRLELPKGIAAFDYNLGCSGYIYGLAIAKSLIETGIFNNIILITAETYTKYLNPTDKSVRTIFGDGAAATFLCAKKCEEEMIGPFIFGTDGSGAEKLIVPAGGHRRPIDSSTAIELVCDDGIKRSPENLYMDGAEIFNFTLDRVPQMIKDLLNKSETKFDDVGYFIFHQANRFMLETLRKKIKIPKDKFCINNEYFANTVSATIPMALEIEFNDGKIKNNDLVMLAGFGVGLSWGATLIKVLF